MLTETSVSAKGNKWLSPPSAGRDCFSACALTPKDAFVMVVTLPPDSEHQTYVTVKPIIVGSLYLPFKEVFEDHVDAPTTAGNRVPVICFLITHPTKGHALFDLGIRKVSPREGERQTSSSPTD